MRRERWIWFLGALIAAGWLLAATAGTARAEQDSRAAATQHFRRGVGLFQAGEHEAALVEFDAAYRARQHYAILLNMAYCYSEMGRLGDAIDHFERFLRDGGDEIPRARRATVEQEMHRLRSQLVPLTIEVSVPGASLRIDGRDVGTSPLAEPVLVRAGAVHTVEARLDGYRTLSREVAAAQGTPQTVEMELERLHRNGRLSVTASVEGAEVFLDDRLLGPAPWTGDVVAGPHVLEVRADRYRASRQEISVDTGGELALEVQLETVGESANLRVASDVEGAAVYLDGRHVGATPLELPNLPSGLHRLRVEQQGYATFDGEVSLEGGSAVTANLDLADPDGGINSAWFWASLGVSLAAGIGSLVTGLLTVRTDNLVNEAIDDERAVPGSVTQEEFSDLQDRGRGLALATDVLWVSTSVFAVATLVLGFFTRFGDPESTLQLEVGGAIGPDSASLTAVGRF